MTEADWRAFCLELAVDAGASCTSAIGVAMAFEDYILGNTVFGFDSDGDDEIV